MGRAIMHQSKREFTSMFLADKRIRTMVLKFNRKAKHSGDMRLIGPSPWLISAPFRARYATVLIWFWVMAIKIGVFLKCNVLALKSHLSSCRNARKRRLLSFATILCINLNPTTCKKDGMRRIKEELIYVRGKQVCQNVFAPFLKAVNPIRKEFSGANAFHLEKTPFSDRGLVNGKANRKSPKLSSLFKMAKNLPDVSSPLKWYSCFQMSSLSVPHQTRSAVFILNSVKSH